MFPFPAPMLGRSAPLVLVRKTIILAAGTTSWAVPADWNSASNIIECIGAGVFGGGAYARSLNMAYTPSGSVVVSVPAGGAAADTYLFDSTTSFIAVKALSAVGNAGGLASGCVYNDIAYSGGDGPGGSGAGGGGAGGPHGAGVAGTAGAAGAGGKGGDGDAGYGGIGPAGGTGAGTVGGDGTQIDAVDLIGSGAGASGTGSSGSVPGNGGKYGGGGGRKYFTGPDGVGGDGVIYITYWA